jgi:hypothetical protein
MTQPVILDATSSFRRMWTNKEQPNTIFMDVRSNKKIHEDWKACMIQKCRDTDIGFKKLTIQADFSHLPFKDNSFIHINFDPPQLIHLGKTSIYYKQFGALEADTWRLVLKQAAKELCRVLAVGGTLNCKWNDRDISDDDVLQLFPIERLYGQVGAHGTSSKTSWFTFVKLECA